VTKLIDKISLRINNQHLTEVLLGAAAAIFSKGAMIIISFALTMLISRHYGAEGLGLYSLSVTFFSITSIFCLIGMQTSVVRLIPEHIARYSVQSAAKLLRNIYASVIALSITLGLIVYLFSNQIGMVFSSTQNVPEIIRTASIFLVFFSVYSLSLQVLRALKKIAAITTLELLLPISRIVVLGVLLTYFYHTMNPIQALLTSVVILCLISVLFVITTFKKSLTGIKTSRVKSLPFRELIRISFPMFLTGAMGVVISQADILMVGWLIDVESAGKYAVATKIALVISLILVALNSIMTPKISELFYSEGKDGKFLQLARAGTRIAGALGLLVFIGIVIFAENILLLFGDEFSSLKTCLVILCVGQLTNCFAGPVASVLNMTGHQVVFNRIMIGTGLLNIFLNYLLIHRFGVEGAAYSTAISLGLWNLLGNFYIKRLYGVSLLSFRKK